MLRDSNADPNRFSWSKCDVGKAGCSLSACLFLPHPVNSHNAPIRSCVCVRVHARARAHRLMWFSFLTGFQRPQVPLWSLPSPLISPQFLPFLLLIPPSFGLRGLAHLRQSQFSRRSLHATTTTTTTEALLFPLSRSSPSLLSVSLVSSQ